MGIRVCFCVLTLLQILHSCKSTDYIFSSELDPFKNIDRHLRNLKSLIPGKIDYNPTDSDDFIHNSYGPENCSKAFEVFVDTALNFTRCAALNARPIQICRACYAVFNSTQDAYQELKSLPDPCHSTFFHSDQICIIDAVYNQAPALWNKSNCASCYDEKLQNITDEFFYASQELDTCLQKSNDFSENSANNTCNLCKGLYIKVTNIYKLYLSKSDVYSFGLCMDVVDKMNITRKSWHLHNCTLGNNSNIGYANVLTAVLVGTMPVFFYLLAKNISIIEDVKIVRPKRKNYISITSS